MGTVNTENSTDQRAHRRVLGPFDAVRTGLLEFKLRLYDLSAGGCLVDSMAAVTTARDIQLRLDLPDGNSVAVVARIVLPPRDIGYAVRFIDLDAETRSMIERALDQALLQRSQN
jgi:PilZ domain